MNYFIDTEFSERGPKYPIELISIGIVAENGREMYAISTEFDADACNVWVKENVLPILVQEGEAPLSFPLRIIASIIREFVGKDPDPKFWGWYAAYDWVCFAQIFGTMMDLPKGWPMYCRDLKQLCDSMGNPKIPSQDKGQHHALCDARYNRFIYDYLAGLVS